MRCHCGFAEAVAQVTCDPFGKPPGVHEHQGRPMRADEIGEAFVVLLPDLVGHHGFK